MAEGHNMRSQEVSRLQDVPRSRANHKCVLGCSHGSQRRSCARIPTGSAPCTLHWAPSTEVTILLSPPTPTIRPSPTANALILLDAITPRSNQTSRASALDLKVQKTVIRLRRNPVAFMIRLSLSNRCLLLFVQRFFNGGNRVYTPWPTIALRHVIS